jgi:hypothetical protein
MLKIEKKKYDDGRTKQAFKDSTDVNKLLNKAMRSGSISHLIKYPEATYGEFDGEFDLLTAHSKLKRAEEIFNELPSEVRNEFSNDSIGFVKWAAKPENNAKLAELIPRIAEPGAYFPNPVKRGGTGAGAATAPPEPVADPPSEPAGTDPA